MRGGLSFVGPYLKDAFLIIWFAPEVSSGVLC
jgi:hypothetical protein